MHQLVSLIIPISLCKCCMCVHHITQNPGTAEEAVSFLRTPIDDLKSSGKFQENKSADLDQEILFMKQVTLLNRVALFIFSPDMAN